MSKDIDTTMSFFVPLHGYSIEINLSLRNGKRIDKMSYQLEKWTVHTSIKVHVLKRPTEAHFCQFRKNGKKV